jgi:hypothetical protein
MFSVPKSNRSTKTNYWLKYSNDDSNWVIVPNENVKNQKMRLSFYLTWRGLKPIRNNEMMKKHCCEDMAYHANFACEIYKNPFECLDKIIIIDEKSNDYGFIIHEGGT